MIIFKYTLTLWNPYQIQCRRRELKWLIINWLKREVLNTKLNYNVYLDSDWAEYLFSSFSIDISYLEILLELKTQGIKILRNHFRKGYFGSFIFCCADCFPKHFKWRIRCSNFVCKMSIWRASSCYTTTFPCSKSFWHFRTSHS